VRYPVSRLVSDPERFEDDAAEGMSKVGMGVVYTRTSSGQPLRRPLSSQEREALLIEYYRPHHQALTDAVAAALEDAGSCLIVDCHSFPQQPLPYEPDPSPDRPDICIGTDEVHTPPQLRDALVSTFEGYGYSVALNRPFRGALVPSRFYHHDNNVQSVMIEVNRALYMNENTGAKSSGFAEARRGLSAVLETIG
jgi:N-formylglutamate amidohydrolase